MKMNQPGSGRETGWYGENKEEGCCVAWLLGLGQRQAQQHGRVGVENQDAHIGLAGQFNDVRQVIRHAFASVLLAKLLRTDPLDVLQVLARPGGRDQLMPIAGL